MNDNFITLTKKELKPKIVSKDKTTIMAEEYYQKRYKGDAGFINMLNDTKEKNEKAYYAAKKLSHPNVKQTVQRKGQQKFNPKNLIITASITTGLFIGGYKLYHNLENAMQYRNNTMLSNGLSYDNQNIINPSPVEDSLYKQGNKEINYDYSELTDHFMMAIENNDHDNLILFHTLASYRDQFLTSGNPLYGYSKGPTFWENFVKKISQTIIDDKENNVYAARFMENVNDWDSFLEKFGISIINLPKEKVSEMSKDKLEKYFNGYVKSNSKMIYYLLNNSLNERGK